MKKVLYYILIIISSLGTLCFALNIFIIKAGIKYATSDPNLAHGRNLYSELIIAKWLAAIFGLAVILLIIFRKRFK